MVLPVSRARISAISLAAAPDDLGGLEEQPRLLRRRSVSPGGEGVAGGGDGDLGFLRAAVGDAGVEVAGVGLEIVEQPAVGGVAPLAAGVPLVGGRVGRRLGAVGAGPQWWHAVSVIALRVR